MYLSIHLWAGLLFGCALALPTPSQDSSSSSPLSNPAYGPIPGQSNLYDDYHGKAPPFPASTPVLILPTKKGTAGPDDLLFQNLLAAEWVIYSFYQQGVEAFNTSSFTDLGWPNTTWDRIAEIRDNEAGHLRIFQDQISATSIKPGICKYDFGFGDSPETYLVTQLTIEIASMAFLTGLQLQAKQDLTKGALTAIAEVETRHAVWALLDVWNADPFGGPSDTVYPYANQLLTLTDQFVIPGSCPKVNPPSPLPNQKLPKVDFSNSTGQGRPGDPIKFVFPATQPHFDEYKDYYAVFLHSVENITVPFNTRTNTSKIPEFEKNHGVIFAVIADEAGAPTEDSVVAGPLILLQQPVELSTVNAE